MRCFDSQLTSKMDVAQTASFIQAMTYETGILDYDDFPRTQEPVWILGTKYSALNELDEIKEDFISRLWFTYRRSFAPIGGIGPTGDTGWGCMLRCGQMMLAQALVNRHLGRAWRWIPGRYDPKYFEILRLFLDKKGSTYSIHQVASMGASEGKTIGEWFGPNTIAQVLKKLAVYDEWSNLMVHVALDNTVIIDDLQQMCGTPSITGGSPSKDGKTKNRGAAAGDITCPNCVHKQQQPATNLRKRLKQDCDSKNKTINGTDSNPTTSNSHQIACDKNPDCRPKTYLQNKYTCTCDQGHGQGQSSWRPLLLVIPLRLGLSEINPVYVNSLKKCLAIPQSVGIIGGKPNHAHWFIGTVEDQMIYLDPHTTQLFTDITEPDQNDDSYHCDYISRMKILQLDPSIAVGFYCGSKHEFDDLCKRIRKDLISEEKTPMFELHKERPRHWPPFEPYSPEGTSTASDFTVVEEAERQFDTDEEFELL